MPPGGALSVVGDRPAEGEGPASGPGVEQTMGVERWMKSLDSTLWKQDL